MTTWSPAFSRALGNLVGFTLSSRIKRIFLSFDRPLSLALLLRHEKRSIFKAKDWFTSAFTTLFFHNRSPSCHISLKLPSFIFYLFAFFFLSNQQHCATALPILPHLKKKQWKHYNKILFESVQEKEMK